MHTARCLHLQNFRSNCRMWLSARVNWLAGDVRLVDGRILDDALFGAALEVRHDWRARDLNVVGRD